MLEIRPTLGSKFFDGKVNSYFTWYFTKKAGNTALQRNSTGMTNYTSWSLVESAYGNLSPYAYTTFKSGADEGFTKSHLGAIYGTPSVEFATTIGNFAPSMSIELDGEIETNESRSKVTADGGDEARSEVLALTGETADENDEIEQRHTTINNNIYPSITYTNAALAGFSTALGAEIYRKYKPKYEAQADGSDVTYKHSGYAIDEDTVSKFSIAYKFANGLKLTNEVRHNMKGVWEEGHADGDTRIENRIKLSTDLF